MQANPLPLVSILCATYNQEKYIKTTVDGFLMQQTQFPFEIIVHDDASSDTTPSILREYELNFPDTFNNIYQTQNQLSQEFSSVTKILANKARGKYIAFCEGDDYWTDPLKLQKQIDLLEANPDYGMVHTNYDVYIEPESRIMKYTRDIPEGNIFKYLLKSNQIGTLTAVFRKEFILSAISEGIFDQGFKMTDYPLWLFIASSSKVGFISDTTSMYRRLRESASNSENPIRAHLFRQSAVDIVLYFSSRQNIMEEMNPVIDHLFRMQLQHAYAFGVFEMSKLPYNYLKARKQLTLRDRILYLACNNPAIVTGYKKLKQLVTKN